MSNTQHNLTDLSVLTTTDSAPYQADPLAVYQLLCHDHSNNILLESAEIDKKHLLKSLLLTNAAVKIVCHGNQVTFHALTTNGNLVLEFAKTQLQDKATLSCSEDNKAFTAIFPHIPDELDEMSRLKATNPFESLRLFQQVKNQHHHPFSVFLGGAFAFDMMSVAEILPHVKDGENTCPDFVYYLAETLVVIDHELETTEIITNSFINEGEQVSEGINKAAQKRIQTIASQLATPITSTCEFDNSKAQPSDKIDTDISDEAFCKIVEQLKENIRAGDIFQVVPSRTFSLPCVDSILSYQALKLSNPSPYMFYLKDEDFCIFGASPESAIKYQQHNRQVEIYPIAGTRPRGFKAQGDISLDLDSRIELELRQDKKESAEHIMLVDLARNDIARVSQAGTRYVADLLKVDRYSHVMHLVSRVCGTLLTDLDALHAYQACMNMGTLSGAPKVKATSLIREVEGKRRGSYGGAVGYVTGQGDMDTCIVIRSAFVKDNIAQIQAGAGVVYDSDPQSEANETRQKAQAVISAIARANQTIHVRKVSCLAQDISEEK
ncbi:anthranilate synthase component 1 [Litorilituus lipolyticus]|uniref:Anthranilate synthase component 1 n=1 Tax=Litorilituus lipolyticus TaxID=2491017 RepID=A0A502KM58_9GAMM|nr:anthranilate synthase component 1 [Litorilituus lipolyticus]TPH12566.1 anthranilate synthase component 1 [Litorilituus lipolyticus]